MAYIMRKVFATAAINNTDVNPAADGWLRLKSNVDDCVQLCSQPRAPIWNIK